MIRIPTFQLFFLLAPVCATQTIMNRTEMHGYIYEIKETVHQEKYHSEFIYVDYLISESAYNALDSLVNDNETRIITLPTTDMNFEMSDTLSSLDSLRLIYSYQTKRGVFTFSRMPATIAYDSSSCQCDRSYKTSVVNSYFYSNLFVGSKPRSVQSISIQSR